MTGFNHGVTGAIIALTVKQPLIAVPLSFISHYVQDLVPHFDFYAGPNKEHLFERKFNLALTTDFVLSLSLMIVLAILFPSEKWLIWTCMIAAAIPDLPKGYNRLYLQKIKKQQLKPGPISRFHSRLQWAESPQGLVIEILWAVVGLVIIWNLQ